MRVLGKWEKSCTDERYYVFFYGIYVIELIRMTVL
jgi:hypothetical protein